MKSLAVAILRIALLAMLLWWNMWPYGTLFEFIGRHLYVPSGGMAMWVVLYAQVFASAALIALVAGPVLAVLFGRASVPLAVLLTTIDPEAPRAMGNMQAPGYRVLFNSSAVRGWATLIPARANSPPEVGQELYVEVDQESVAGTQFLDSTSTARVVAQSIRGNYQVAGVVFHVTTMAEPPGERILVVHAGEASFTLLQSELAGCYPQVGDWLLFNVTDASLWDKAL